MKESKSRFYSQTGKVNKTAESYGCFLSNDHVFNIAELSVLEDLHHFD